MAESDAAMRVSTRFETTEELMAVVGPALTRGSLRVPVPLKFDRAFDVVMVTRDGKEAVRGAAEVISHDDATTWIRFLSAMDHGAAEIMRFVLDDVEIALEGKLRTAAEVAAPAAPLPLTPTAPLVVTPKHVPPAPASDFAAEDSRVKRFDTSDVAREPAADDTAVRSGKRSTIDELPVVALPSDSKAVIRDSKPELVTPPPSRIVVAAPARNERETVDRFPRLEAPRASRQIVVADEPASLEEHLFAMVTSDRAAQANEPALAQSSGALSLLTTPVPTPSPTPIASSRRVVFGAVGVVAVCLAITVSTVIWARSAVDDAKQAQSTSTPVVVAAKSDRAYGARTSQGSARMTPAKSAVERHAADPAAAEPSVEKPPVEMPHAVEPAVEQAAAAEPASVDPAPSDDDEIEDSSATAADVAPPAGARAAAVERPVVIAAAVPKAAAAPSADRCTLNISSSVKGSKVRIGGRERGKAPQSLETPCNKPVVVEVRHSRYDDFKQTVTPTAGETAVVAKLEREQTLLTVWSEPAGASVTYNGRSIGKTPLTTKVKRHEQGTLRFKAPGRAEDWRRIVPKEAKKTVSITLAPK